MKNQAAMFILYTPGDFVEADEQFRSRPRGGRKRKLPVFEDIMRKRITPPSGTDRVFNQGQIEAGLTGRKIIIDTYGGCGAHGGGAFSGKDPTKVDRSGAYLVRQAAKSIVANGLARRGVQVSYAIGVPEPLSVFVDTYGTGKMPDKEILKIVKETFDFRPGMISIILDLKRGGNGRFLKTAAYGHFGRDDPDFTWEVVKPLKWDKPQSYM